jgi:hypothetical protein
VAEAEGFEARKLGATPSWGWSSWPLLCALGHGVRLLVQELPRGHPDHGGVAQQEPVDLDGGCGPDMTGKLTELVIDCADPNGLARFWCSVLGYEVQDEEVRRLPDLGARHADVGQGDVSWVVLADPEGMVRKVHQLRWAFEEG